jgi:hypothetical protein
MNQDVPWHTGRRGIGLEGWGARLYGWWVDNMMNTHVVPCPACQTPLNVPPSASGRRARCPACGDRFIIPTRTDLLDDTVSGWIDQDVSDVIDDRDRAADENHASQVRPAIKGEADPKPTEPAAGETIVGVPFDSQGIGQTEKEAAEPRPKPRPIIKQARRAFPDDDESSKYPKNLRTDPKSPHLVVLKCGSAGVRFAFDSKWLSHEGFRTSMPTRCAYSGAADRTKLIARPMVFSDRARGVKTSAADISSVHDVRSLGDAGPRKIMQMMGTMEGMPSPFLYPLPYYISTRYANKTIHCMTRDRPSGGITAEVVIPDAVCALEWLSRVNGVCGEEYEMLERDTSLLHGDLFQELSEVCRGRIQSWCKLRPREVFQVYLNDADFGRLDEGLAGVIVTDQRVVYCKYHHRGQVRLDEEDARIIAKPGGRFYSLTLQVGEQRSRMCKLLKADVPKLESSISKDAVIEVLVMQ